MGFLSLFLPLLLILSSPAVFGASQPEESQLEESQLEESLFGGRAGGVAEVSEDGVSCDSVVKSVTDACRDYVSGTDPPQPFFNNPCCKALKTPDFGCLCGRIKFRELNQRALLSVIIICNVRQRCIG